MKKEQLERMTNGKGFIAALDQSGGSTPKALRLYGIAEDSYQGDDEMFDLVHAMRARIIKSPAFTSESVSYTHLDVYKRQGYLSMSARSRTLSTLLAL